MRLQHFISLALLPTVLPLATAAAQTCLGTATFATSRVRLGAYATRWSVEDLAIDHIGAQVAFGSPGSAFATPGYENTPVQKWVTTQTHTFNGTIGCQYAVGESSVEICPLVSARYSTSSESGYDAKATTFGFGTSIGFRKALSANVELVPTLGADFDVVNTSVGCPDGCGGSESANYGSVTVGAGLVSGKRVTRSPSVGRLVGIPGPPMVRYGLGVSYGIGRNRRVAGVLPMEAPRHCSRSASIGST